MWHGLVEGALAHARPPPPRPTGAVRVLAEAMNTSEATELIAAAIPGPGGTWADLGAGTGTFTRALARLLGSSGRIYAVEQDPRLLQALRGPLPDSTATVIPVVGDLTGPFELPGLSDELLDGILIANTLHFIRDAEGILNRLVALVRPGGRVVLVEYDGRGPSPWTPHPVPIARLPALARAAGLSSLTVTAKRPSAYGGILYAAVADRLLTPSASAGGA